MLEIVLQRGAEAEGWRRATRALVLAGAAPDTLAWTVGAEPTPLDAPAGAFSVPRAVADLIGPALASGAAERFALLYRLVWRCHGGERPGGEDADLLAARRLAGAGQRRLAEAAPDPLAAARAAAASCRVCALWQPATQTVFGEGPPEAKLMLVGEQPGDQEDLAGRPFVGPAGQLLDRALAEAGLDRATLYLTNAVKHFKHEPRGKRRLHQTPDAGDIAVCKFWLDLERAAIRPRLTLLLGASAARAVLGRAVTIGRERGRPIGLPDQSSVFVTVHPSYLLRVPDEATRAREYTAFVADLREAGRIAHG